MLTGLTGLGIANISPRLSTVGTCSVSIYISRLQLRILFSVFLLFVSNPSEHIVVNLFVCNSLDFLDGEALGLQDLGLEVYLFRISLLSLH